MADWRCPCHGQSSGDRSRIATLGDVDSTAATIRSRKGRLAQINTSRCVACRSDQRFEVLGSKGMLQRGNHRLALAHFFECLQSGELFHTTIEDGVAAQRPAEAMKAQQRRIEDLTARVIRLEAQLELLASAALVKRIKGAPD